MNRTSTKVLVSGPLFFAVFGPMVYVLPNVPMMLSGRLGALAGVEFAFYVYATGALPAFIAGLVQAAVIVFISQRSAWLSSRSGSSCILIGSILGALTGGSATSICLRGFEGLVILGAIAGLLCGAIFTPRAFRYLAARDDSHSRK